MFKIIEVVCLKETIYKQHLEVRMTAAYHCPKYSYSDPVIKMVTVERKVKYVLCKLEFSLAVGPLPL